MFYRQEFRPTCSPWVLYDDLGRKMTEFDTRAELLTWCRNMGFGDVKWSPSWVRPNTGRIRGTPKTYVGPDDGIGRLVEAREDEF